jgi:YD repeat-containing protein
MSLEKKFIRDGRNRLVGSVTSGYSNTRDAHGRLVSIDTPDAGLLFGRDDE